MRCVPSLVLALPLSVCGYVAIAETDQGAIHDAVSADKRNIDFNKCAVAIIEHQIAPLNQNDSVYVSIGVDDPDPATLGLLRKSKAQVGPGSKMPRIPDGERHSHNWHISLGPIRSGTEGEYWASLAYYCGSLCAGAVEYRLSKSGDTCVVLATKILRKS